MSRPWRARAAGRNFSPAPVEYPSVKALRARGRSAESRPVLTFNKIPKEIAMNFCRHRKSGLWLAQALRWRPCLSPAHLPFAGQNEHSTLVITSTNDATGNAVVVFKLDTTGNALAGIGGNAAHRRQGRRQHQRGHSAVQRRSGSGSELRIEHRQPIRPVRQFHCHWSNVPSCAWLHEP